MKPRGLVPVLLIVDHLRTSARLAVVVAMLVVPALIATWAFATSENSAIAFSAKERAGVTVIRPALHALASTVGGGQPDLAAVVTSVRATPELDLGTPP